MTISAKGEWGVLLTRAGRSNRPILNGHHADSNDTEGVQPKAMAHLGMPVLEQRQVVGVKDGSGHSPASES